MNIKLLKFLSFLLMIIFCVSCSSGNIKRNNTTVIITADFPTYNSIEEITQKADTIIKGTILSTRIEELNVKSEQSSSANAKKNELEPTNSKSVYTIYTVKINDIYKGNVSYEENIEVKTLGGSIENTDYICEDFKKFENNKKYIMFLASYPNSPSCLLNPIQASYLDTLDSEDNFESLNKKNNLKLSNNYLKKNK